MNWRNHLLTLAYHTLVAILPVMGIPLFLLPVLIFFALHVEKGNWQPFIVLPLTILGVLVGAFLPRRYFQLRPFESNGRIYGSLGLRYLRLIVADGDLFRRLAERVKPASLEHLKRTEASLEHRLSMTRWYERCHWAILLGTLPALVWAVSLGTLGWALWFFVVCIFLNVYPIILQRYTRSRLLCIQNHRRYRRTPLTPHDGASSSPA